jgi:hypothetical protein
LELKFNFWLSIKVEKLLQEADLVLLQAATYLIQLNTQPKAFSLLNPYKSPADPTRNANDSSR